MKKVILLALLMPYLAFGQIVENFESGDIVYWFQNAPGRWAADTSSALNGSYSLHHVFDNPDTGSDGISIGLKNFHPSIDTSKWSFTLRHGYDPSSSNNWAVFLMSDAGPDRMSFSTGTSGFAIGVNMTGSDDSLRLVKIKNGLVTTVVNCRINWQLSIGMNEPVKIVTERSVEGGWIVSVQKMNGEIMSTTHGIDNELFNPAWFGILYRYSSTKDRLLWIDDIKIEGDFHEDNDAPVLTDCFPSGKNSVKIIFNEPPLEELMVPENFSLNSIENNTCKVEKTGPLSYNISFEGGLKNKSLNNLEINKICDNVGNCSVNIRTSFTPVWAEPGDVVITEIMADPVPQVSLPAREYLELTNLSVYSFNLKNWKLKTTEQNYLLPDIIFKPGNVIILCQATDTILFQKYGTTAGLKLFPTLTDAGRIICLTDSSDYFIHGVEYSQSWYGDGLKKGGGWSLEIVDADMPFYSEGNWKPSTSHLGGTPGAVNSVTGKNPDFSFIGIMNVFPDDNNTITLTFSEPVPDLLQIIKNLKIGDFTITEAGSADLLYRIYSLKLSGPLQPGKEYNFEFSDDIRDFAGNMIERKDFSFGLPEKAENGDVLFNELLFNPWPGDPDYIELYNSSEKIIDASRLQMVSVNDDSADTSQLYPLSDEKRCIMPGSYFAVTTGKNRIEERYYASDPENLFEAENIPALSDDEGHLILLNRELEKTDEVFYNEKMHYSLLTSYEGVALEKTAPQLNSEAAGNWHSAAESSGWGTPGAPNSMFVEEPATADRISLSSSRITPDNDGYEDFLTIILNLEGNDNVISALIFDEAGNYIKKLASNMLAGTEATLIWDGTADDGAPVRTGIYIVYITLYDNAGKTGKWKKICTVIR